VFRDESGRPVTLGSLFEGKPQVITFNYLRCPELCSLVASGATEALRQLRATAGRDFGVITISIDPTDTPTMAAAWARDTVSRYGRRGAPRSWHVLVGRQPDIEAVAGAAGFHYRYDERSKQYAHPTGLIIVTPSGVVSRYFLGIDFEPKALSTAIDRAAHGKTGESVFDLVFVCFSGGTPAGKYGRLIWTVLSASVTVTILGVFGGIGWMLWGERRKWA
jgi:protein SCO1/2